MQAEIKTVEVVRNGTKVGSTLRFVSYLIGWLLILGGILLSLTLIGIIFGIPMILVGIITILIAQGRQEVKCPHCMRKMFPRRMKDENFTCTKCKRLTIIEWK